MIENKYPNFPNASELHQNYFNSIPSQIKSNNLNQELSRSKNINMNQNPEELKIYGNTLNVE